MIKKWQFPTITTAIIIGLSLLAFIYINKQLHEKEIVIDKPMIHQVTEEETFLDLKTIVHEANKSVVQIEAISDQVTLTGSGFLFNDQGDIVTNAHVIKDADYIYVRTANANIYPAAVVGISDEIDIAVIRVPELANYASLTIETKNTMEIGDEIIALGSPHGFQNTVTTGIISGIERNFFVDGFNYDNVLQISAQILQGNSGGPLLARETGKVVGINSVGTEDGSIGFSIPLYLVHEQITEWSNETENNQLTFPETDDIVFTVDAERLEEDAIYMIDYFFESLSLRDYISAYTLLGSDLQLQMTYTDFRNQYIQIIDLTYEDIVFDKNNEHKKDEISANVDVQLESHATNSELSDIETVTFNFTVGYENEQLKILAISLVE
ncbi:MAG TPA: S1C family serine protease [Bacillota bacterium]|nr:S1C family serine protease [Bacillota bacterium]